MSIWTKPIFGTKARASTPATPVAHRCARMKMLRHLETMPRGVTGFLGALVLLVIVGELSLASGNLVTGTWNEKLRRLATQFGWQSFAAITFVIAVHWLAVPALARLAFDRRVRTMEHLASARRVQRNVKWYALGMLAFPWVMTLITGGSWWPIVLVTGLQAAAAGGAFFLIGLRSRSGSTIVCSRCDYPMRSWRGAPELCNECGSKWKEPWRATFGIRRFQPRIVATGLGLLVLAGTLCSVVILAKL